MICVSVIVPIYNVEPYLSQCLDSLINQTLTNIEILCIDDGSTDDSIKLVKQYAQKDKRIKFYENVTNKGVAETRNFGIDQSQGEYIGFIDSDDWIDLNFYEELYKKAKISNADIVKGNMRTVNNGKTSNTIINKAIKRGIEKGIFLGVGFFHGFGTAIYKSSMIKDQIYFPNISNGEDLVFLLKATISCKNFALCNDVYYYYLQRKDSTTHTIVAEKLYTVIKHFNMLVDTLNASNLAKEDYIAFYNSMLYTHVLDWYSSVYESFVLKHYRLDFIHSIKQLYVSCLYKEELHEKYESPYLQYLSGDKLNLQDFEQILLGLGIRLGKTKTVRVWLLTIIPLFKIKTTKFKTKYYLFSFIPLFKIKTMKFRTNYYLFGFIPCYYRHFKTDTSKKTV